MADPGRLEDVAADPGRLDDRAVAGRLARIDDLLERVEGAPGPSAQAALDAVRALTEVYGEALARVLENAGPPLVGMMADDELLGHLMVLHDIHPEPVDRRVTRAVDRLRPAVRAQGGDVELVGIDGSIARVRLKESGCGSGCGSAAGGVAQAVREAVLAAAPELSEVERLPDAPAPAAFVPLAALTHRPTPTGAPRHEPAQAGS